MKALLLLTLLWTAQWPLSFGPRDLNTTDGELGPISRVKVRGFVFGAENLGPVETGRVLLSGAHLTKTLETTIGRNGVFEFKDVVSGTYALQALPASWLPVTFATRSSGAFGPIHISPIPSSDRVTVSVGDTDVTGIVVAVPPTQQVVGRLVFENRRATVRRFALSVSGEFGRLTVNVEPNVDGVFTAVLPVGEYRVSVDDLPSDYTVRSIRRGGLDLQRQLLRLAGTPNRDELRITLGTR
jgi:hypothetical protein